jgi:hypothetical protein
MRVGRTYPGFRDEVPRVVGLVAERWFREVDEGFGVAR